MPKDKRRLPASEALAEKSLTEPARIVVDDLNLEIVKHLTDGRKSFGDIAKELGVTENTVRSRFRKLVDGGVLEVKGTVDPYKIPNHFIVIVGVKLKTVDLVTKGEEFKKLRGVVSVAVVTGQYDLILTVLLNDKFSIKRFYTEEVARITEVLSTETWVVYHNVNIQVPYIL